MPADASAPFDRHVERVSALARLAHAHRVTLSNRRLVKLRNDRVTFTWKDYADSCWRKEMTLEAVEFVCRFALHIIPKGLVRIRQYGLLAHRDRGERLALCRSLLATAGPSSMPAP
jgi:Putative transposase